VFGTLGRFRTLRGSFWPIALAAALLVWPGGAAVVQAQPASTPDERTPGARAESGRAGGPGEVIVLSGPSDLSELLKKLKQPDLILIRPGSPAAATVAPAAGPLTPAIAAGSAAGAGARSHAVSAVKVRGKLDDDLAHLAVELDLSLLVPGPAWVPLGLESPIVTSAREGERELELRALDRGRWEVRLEGTGRHTLVADLQVPVKLNPERKHLDLGIPLAASTYLELEIPARVQDVALGTGEPVGKAPLAGGKGTRLSAHLTPRSRLALEWSDESMSPAQYAPLLAAQVEIAVHADGEAVTTRSSWEIRCVRGTLHDLQIQLDKQEVVQTIQLGDQFLIGGIEGNVLKIPLPEPMGPRTTRQLTIETRRPLPAGPRRILALPSLPLVHAVEQSGAIGVTQSPDLWLSVDSMQGLLRIDPRDLPSKLAARPGTSLAFRFLDRQFSLDLAVEDAPPLFRASTRARLVLEDETATSQTSIEIQRVRGRLFSVDVAVPSGVDLVSAGPPEVVQSQSARKLQAKTEGPVDTQTGPPAQLLTLQLTPLARDQKALVLNLTTRQRIAPDQALRLGLVAPAGGVPGSSVVSVFTEPNTSFELARDYGAGNAEDSGFRVIPPATPAAYGDGTRERAADAVLTSDQNRTWLRGRLTRHLRAVSYENTVSAQVFAGRVDVRQETALQVRNGSIPSLRVRAPFARAELWDVQCKEYARREEVGRGDREGDYLLHFDPPITDRSVLIFRFRIPLEPVLAAAEVKSRIPWVRIDEPATGSTAIALAAAPGIKAAVEEAAWSGTGAEWEYQGASASALRYRLARPGGEGERSGLPLAARLLEQIALPSVLAPRALLRTVVGPGRDSRTCAWYWLEGHGGEVFFRLPEGATIVRVRIDGRATDQLESLPPTESVRLNLPAESKSRPVLVELVYQTPAYTGSAWSPPALEEGAVVLQTLWVVQVPASQTMVGVPDGWADENEWYWDTYVWKRRPWRSMARLGAWLTGSPALAGNVDEVLGAEQDDAHSFLFSRSGEPGPLRPTLASRAWIVGLCSGAVLLLGFLVTFARVPFRFVWMGLAVLGVLAAATVQPSTLLLVAQSAVSGVILTFLGLLIQRLIGRERHWTGPLAGTSQPPRPVGDGLAAASPAGVGSDDSTAVRVRRPSTTLDYVAAPVSLAAEHEPSSGSQTAPSG
jgi:hypothetical protein